MRGDTRTLKKNQAARRSRSARKTVEAGSPRKHPRQSRSKATWDAIIGAAARLLTERPAADVSMRAVAARAGVSVGSLYQYLSSKEALLYSVAERHVEVGLDLLARRFAEDEPDSVDDVLALLVDEAVTAHVHHPHLHRHLEAALTGAQREALARRVEGTLVTLLEQRAARLGVTLDAAWVRALYRASVAVVHASVSGDGLPPDETRARLWRLLAGVVHEAVGRRSDALEVEPPPTAPHSS